MLHRLRFYSFDSKQNPGRIIRRTVCFLTRLKRSRKSRVWKVLLLYSPPHLSSPALLHSSQSSRSLVIPLPCPRGCWRRGRVQMMTGGVSHSDELHDTVAVKHRQSLHLSGHTTAATVTSAAATTLTFCHPPQPPLQPRHHPHRLVARPSRRLTLRSWSLSSSSWLSCPSRRTSFSVSGMLIPITSSPCHPQPTAPPCRHCCPSIPHTSSCSVS